MIGCGITECSCVEINPVVPEVNGLYNVQERPKFKCELCKEAIKWLSSVPNILHFEQ